MTESSKDVTPLVAFFERTGATALVAAGLIEFTPPLFLLIVHRSELPTQIWLTWLIPALIYASALHPAIGRSRALVQTIAGLLFLGFAIVFPQSYGPGWIPLPFAAFAVAFGAAFTLTVAPALAVFALAALLNLIAVLHPTPQMILAAADLADGWIGPIFILIAAPALLGMAYSWRRAAGIADDNSRQIESATGAAYRAVQVQSARTSVDRRIHETVLNTLNAIAQGGANRGDLLRSECRRDIEQLSLGVLPAQEVSLGSLVRESVVAANLISPHVEIDVHSEYLLPQQSAGALRDALVEALRNVERHAEASNVEIIGAQFGDSLEVTVRDDGRGFAAGDNERFGLRNTIKASLAAIGGEAVVGSSPARGTSVRLRVPILVAAELQVPVSPVIDILLDSIGPRVLLFAPAVFGLVMLPWIAGGLGANATAFALSFVLFLACNLALAALWSTRWRILLTLLTTVAGILAYAVAYADADSCSAASSVHWIINSVAGGIGLLLFAAQRYWWHWLILPVVTAGGLVLALGLPADCRAVPTMSLVVTVVYMSAALYLMTVLFREFDLRRRNALELWAASVEYQTEIERQITVTSQWSRVSASTTALLADIASGELSPSETIVRERAAAEESQLRGMLGMERLSTSFFWRTVLELIEEAAGRGLGIDAAVISVPRNPRPIPAFVHELIAAIVLGAPTRTVSIRLFVDEGQPEVLITAPADVMNAAWRQVDSLDLPSPGDTAVHEGVALSLTELPNAQMLLSIRGEGEGVDG